LSGKDQCWVNCQRKAIPGDRFCAVHRDALDGAILGLLGRENNLHAIQILFEEETAWRRNARTQTRRRLTRALLAEIRRLRSAAQATEAQKIAVPHEVAEAAPKAP